MIHTFTGQFKENGRWSYILIRKNPKIKFYRILRVAYNQNIASIPYFTDIHVKRFTETASHPYGCCSRMDFHAFRGLQKDLASAHGWRDKLWFELPLNDLPEWPCCYVVYYKGDPIYIGQTENLKLRFRQHRSKSPWRYAADKIKAKLPRTFGQWAMDERRLLVKITTEYNRMFATSRPSFCL